MKIHDNGIIETYIGDTILYPLYLNIGSEWHPERLKLADGDSITFDIFEANKSVSVLSKTISADDAEHQLEDVTTEFGDILIEFDTKETSILHSGVYYYEVHGIVTIDKKRTYCVFIPRTKFIVR